jgi:hypothetical protein
MKLPTMILLAALILMVTTTFSSHVLLRKKYDNTNRNDLYWIYGKNGAMDIL